MLKFLLSFVSILILILTLQPFPEEVEEAAYNLQSIVKDTECRSYRIYSLSNMPYNYSAFQGSVLVYNFDPGTGVALYLA